MDARPTERRTPFDLVKHRGIWYTLSVVVILGGLLALFTKGLNFGTDFTGGAEVQFETELPLPESEAERATLVDQMASALGLSAGSVKAVMVSDSPPKREILVRFQVETQDELIARQGQIEQQLESTFGDRLGDIRPSSDANFIGPTIGKELRTQALVCLVVGLAAILSYIWVRYNVKMATTGILALAHDVLVMVGAMAIGQWEVGAPFVAALLTVVGFSINDSVVIFDRIRENMQSRSAQRQPLAEVVNYALWETLSRSINTSMTVVIVLVCLLLFGGSTLHEFTVALLIGMVSGAYSSIFVGPQLMVTWEEWQTRRQAARLQSAVAARPTGGTKRRESAMERARAAAEEVSAAQPATADGPPAQAGAVPPTTTKDRAQASKSARGRDKGPRKSKRRY